GRGADAVLLRSASLRCDATSGTGSRVASSVSPGRQVWLRYATAPPSPPHLWKPSALACSAHVHSSSDANRSELHFICDVSLSCVDTARMARGSVRGHRP